MKKRLTLTEFIDRSKQIHTDKYDYSKVSYITSHHKVIIICPHHGEFIQFAKSHIRGAGCRKCASEKRGKNQVMSLEQFISRSNDIHGYGKYDYSEVEYITAQLKVIIICPAHGSFLQSPDNHLHGHGCPSCAGQAKYGVQDFATKANKIHKNIYDYSKTDYDNLNNKVVIICKQHGEFIQHAGSHLRGTGCPKCAASIHRAENLWLNSLNIPEEFRQKILYIDNQKIRADAYNPTTNTIYEFWGDFWHGNPRIFDPTDINKINKKTFGELFENTQIKRKLILDAGYNLIEKWETDL